MKHLTLKLLFGLIASTLTIHSMAVSIPNTVDRYGFEKVERSEHQKGLINKFSAEKGQMDKAIENTKALIQQSQGKIYLPELYLRLAELYIEKSRIVYYLRRTESGAAVKSAMESLESTALKSQAIETYQRIINQYPDFADMDKVHFYLAHEYRELNRLKLMRGEYLTLIKKYPNSELVAQSHLLLADYYSDSKKLNAAKKHLQAVLKYPLSPAIGIAQYKLAWVHISKKEYGKALKMLEKSVSPVNGTKDVEVDSYGRVDIRAEAFSDMAFIYSNHYKKATAEQALAYFKKFAWSRQSYIVVLEKLAYRYLVKKKWSHSALIYRQLSSLNHEASKLLEYADNIYVTVKELKSYENAFEDVKVIVKALRSIKYSVHVKDDIKRKALEDYEIFARDVSTRLHAKAKRTNSVENFSLSADAYDLYLGFFDDSIYHEKMQQNQAEALFNAKRFTEAGNVYEKLSLNAQKSSNKKKYLYSSTVSFYEALKDRQQLNYYETVQAQSGLAYTGEMFVRNFPKAKQVPNVLFNIAWIRYDEGKFDQSIELFTRFIKTYPTGKSTKTAVKLIVDAYTIKEDYPGLVDFGKAVAANKNLSRAIKAGVAQIASSAEAKMVSNMTVASIDDWETGKDELLQFAQKHQSSSLGIQALNALFISSKEKNDLQTMQSTGQNIIANYPKSNDADSVLKSMIEASLRSSQYRVLVGNLEQYAKQFSGSATAQDFLMQAAQIRQIMNQPQMANRHYRSLLSQYKLTQDNRLELTVFIANNEINDGNPRGAIQALQKQRSKVGRSNSVEVDARLAALYAEIGHDKKSARYFSSALNGFNKGQGKNNPVVKQMLSEVSYQQAQGLLETFNTTQLQDVLDNDVVALKTEIFESLQGTYYSILDLANAKWSLLASYRLYEVNMEYANFLASAPLPEMTADEQDQYREIIGQKVAEYRAQGEEYLLAGQQLAERLKSFDPLMADYESSVAAHNSSMTPFDMAQQDTRISIEAFDDEELRALHNRMSQNPKDAATQISLAKAYYTRGDIGQAAIISQSLTDDSTISSDLKADAFTLLGLNAIARGDDQHARENFNQALAEESSHWAANINIAKLLEHHGFHEQAETLKDNAVDSQASAMLVHGLEQ